MKRVIQPYPLDAVLMQARLRLTQLQQQLAEATRNEATQRGTLIHWQQHLHQHIAAATPLQQTVLSPESSLRWLGVLGQTRVRVTEQLSRFKTAQKECEACQSQCLTQQQRVDSLASDQAQHQRQQRRLAQQRLDQEVADSRLARRAWQTLRMTSAPFGAEPTL